MTPCSPRHSRFMHSGKGYVPLFVCLCCASQTHPWPALQALPPGPSYSSRWPGSSSLHLPLRQCACVEEQKENVNNCFSLNSSLPLTTPSHWIANWPRDTQLPPHVTLCQLEASLILLGGGHIGGTGRSATNICPPAFSQFPSLAARKHTNTHWYIPRHCGQLVSLLSLWLPRRASHWK